MFRDMVKIRLFFLVQEPPVIEDDFRGVPVGFHAAFLQ